MKISTEIKRLIFSNDKPTLLVLFQNFKNDDTIDTTRIR